MISASNIRCQVSCFLSVPGSSSQAKEARRKECWKADDWWLNTASDSRLHGQPSTSRITFNHHFFESLSFCNMEAVTMTQGHEVLVVHQSLLADWWWNEQSSVNRCLFLLSFGQRLIEWITSPGKEKTWRRMDSCSWRAVFCLPSNVLANAWLIDLLSIHQETSVSILLYPAALISRKARKWCAAQRIDMKTIVPISLSTHQKKREWKERCSGTYCQANDFLVVKDDSISEKPG